MTRKSKRAIVVFLSIMSGTLCWALFERILGYFAIPLSLSVGPVGFDAFVLSVFVTLNPGSLIGLAAALFFRKKQ